jgi:hypothetical protein
MSLDLMSCKYMKSIFNNMELELNSITSSNSNNLSIKNLMKTIFSYSKELNDIKIKSLFVYYNHDLENRSSFLLDEKHMNNFIKYKKDNLDISKEIIFKEFSIISNLLIGMIIEEYETNNSFKELIKFLYYLDSEHFIELFSMFLVANSLFKKNKILDLCIDEMKDKKMVRKELDIFKSIMGL